MGIDIKKITLKGHNSFYLRDGWLNKVLLLSKEEMDDIRTKDASIKLGVGSGMVKAIKFYLSAMGLVNFSKKNWVLEFFYDVQENDRYLEYNFTKYILHYHLIKNDIKATTWHVFYNYINYSEMSKAEAFEYIMNIYREVDPEKEISSRSLEDDINCLINLYTYNHNKKLTPEDNMASPLADLMLLEYDGKVIKKVIPPKKTLPKDVILYIMLSESNEDDINGKYRVISIDELLSGENNVGKILNLDRSRLYEYLIELQDENDIEIRDTAGLDQIFISTEIDKTIVFNNYYEEHGNV